MYCQKCGKENADDAVFCTSCGAGMGSISNNAPMFSVSNAAASAENNDEDKKAKKKKKRKIILWICIGFFAFLFICGMAGADDTGTDTSSENSSSTSEESVSENASFSVKNAKDEGAYTDSEILSFYKDCIGQIEVDSKDFRKEVSEERFFPLWCSCVYAELSSDTDFNKITRNKLSSHCHAYRLIWEDTEKLGVFDEAIDKMEDYLRQKDTIVESLGYNPHTSVISEADFYVIKRLETRYDDNFLGDLQEIYDDITADNSSNWLASDVEYIYGTPVSGENDYVIYSIRENPFTKEGAYKIRYVDTGKTMELIDSSGFKYDVPVYRMVESGGEYTEADYNALADSFASEVNNVRSIVFDNWKANDDSAKDISPDSFTVSDLVNMSYSQTEAFFGNELSFVEGNGGCGIFTVEGCPDTYFWFLVEDWTEMYVKPEQPVSYIYVDGNVKIDENLSADMTLSQLKSLCEEKGYTYEVSSDYDEMNAMDYTKIRIEQHPYKIVYKWFAADSETQSADETIICGLSSQL